MTLASPTPSPTSPLPAAQLCSKQDKPELLKECLARKQTDYRVWHSFCKVAECAAYKNLYYKQTPTHSSGDSNMGTSSDGHFLQQCTGRQMLPLVKGGKYMSGRSTLHKVNKGNPDTCWQAAGRCCLLCCPVTAVYDTTAQKQRAQLVSGHSVCSATCLLCVHNQGM